MAVRDHDACSVSTRHVRERVRNGLLNGFHEHDFLRDAEQGRAQLTAKSAQLKHAVKVNAWVLLQVGNASILSGKVYFFKDTPAVSSLQRVQSKFPFALNRCGIATGAPPLRYVNQDARAINLFFQRCPAVEFH